jgi:hypothetical protein
MPRFYFDTVVDGATAHDDVGRELADLDAAGHEALRSAAEIAVDLARTAQSTEIAVKVRVGGVEPLATARLSMRLD